MESRNGRESLARSFPSAARQANVSHHRAGHMHALRLLGTQHLAPRISLRSPIAGRRRTQRPPNQRVDFHHAVRNVPGLRELRLAGRLVGTPPGLSSSTSSSPPSSRPSMDSRPSGPARHRNSGCSLSGRWSDSSAPASSRCSEPCSRSSIPLPSEAPRKASCITPAAPPARWRLSPSEPSPIVTAWATGWRSTPLFF